MKRPILVAALALLPFTALAGPERDASGMAFTQEQDGQVLLEENCLACHDGSYITSANLTREQWGEVLDLMLGMGMPPLEPDVQKKVLDYLEETHGPRKSSGSGGERPAMEASSDSGTDDLPWAFPRYRPNPLYWKEP